MTEKTAKIVAEFDEQFSSNLPAMSVEVISSNSNIAVQVIDYTSFSIRFKITNRSSDHQLVSGSVGNLKENLYVFGKTLHEGAESRVSREARGNSSNTIEVDSKWIQSKEAAESVADWIINRVGNEKLEVDCNIVGTPVLEVGDIIKIYHHDIPMGDREFIISAVGLSWSDGLTTRIRAVEL